ncbi:DUF58 domain-containing protein [Gimesia aquarii]|uniref:DUF58 domain-containing protein n=1 Tax=Gimesia aquarii TaxID=2527964 RepID=A0A517X2W8_9PLAN|nr:DUF58 domain-containing protein [Gimesia aquarii]QDU11845.1 hypothetical protein V202x_52700 [Gimesia aquarii]
MKNPFWCLAISVLTALICGILVNTAILYIAGAISLVVLSGVVWPWISMSGIVAEVTFNKRRVRCGESVGARLIVKNRWPWPAWGVYLRHRFSEQSGHLCEVAIEYIPGWKVSEFNWSFAPQKRGVYSTQTAFLETAFPFGLYRKKRELSVESKLIVWPEVQTLTSMPEIREVNSSEDRFASNRVGDFGDVTGTREFRIGDSLRRVHWAQTARQGQMIVTERQAASVCALRVIPDLNPSSYGTKAEHRAALEAVLRITASICESLHQQHAWVECLVGDKLFRCENDSYELRKLFDALAHVPVEGVNDSALHHKVSSLSQIVVTTSRGYEKHLSFRHAQHNQRIIVVHDHFEQEMEAASSCQCEPWLKLNDPEESRNKVFVDRWKKACYAT